ncbi:unnamed protein product [Chilo suppressalis]|uniref:Uncharacterized protein n=1 Tax=Chilo suppressalis TaxID=168631 RepID=A0ABN8B175_CHISP|nr:unnamed protein product [Chilo suppressalis]
MKIYKATQGEIAFKMSDVFMLCDITHHQYGSKRDCITSSRFRYTTKPADHPALELNEASQNNLRGLKDLQLQIVDMSYFVAVSEHGNRDVCVVKKTVQGRGRVAFVMAKFLQMKRLEVSAPRRVGGPAKRLLDLNYIMYGSRLDHATSRYVSAG